MYNEELVKVNNNVYFPLRIITRAFCLEKSFVEHLLIKTDKYKKVIEMNSDLLVPLSVFKKMRFPQDEHFFKLVIVYLKGR